MIFFLGPVRIVRRLFSYNDFVGCYSIMFILDLLLWRTTNEYDFIELAFMDEPIVCSVSEPFRKGTQTPCLGTDLYWNKYVYVIWISKSWLQAGMFYEILL